MANAIEEGNEQSGIIGHRCHDALKAFYVGQAWKSQFIYNSISKQVQSQLMATK